MDIERRLKDMMADPKQLRELLKDSHAGKEDKGTRFAEALRDTLMEHFEINGPDAFQHIMEVNLEFEKAKVEMRGKEGLDFVSQRQHMLDKAEEMLFMVLPYVIESRQVKIDDRTSGVGLLDALNKAPRDEVARFFHDIMIAMSSIALLLYAYDAHTTMKNLPTGIGEAT